MAADSPLVETIAIEAPSGSGVTGDHQSSNWATITQLLARPSHEVEGIAGQVLRSTKR